MIKECTRPHALSHLVSGAGIALLVLYLLPTLMPYVLALGLILLIFGILWDFASIGGRK
jgi:hypothetical protein